MGIILRNRPVTTEKRRILRQNSTAPEQRLWYFLRNKNIQNIKFRRQYAVGSYILDFYASEIQLGIEIDGDSHFNDSAQAYDAIRTKYLNDCDITILRFTNADIMNNIGGVLDRISEAVTAQRPSTSSG